MPMNPEDLPNGREQPQASTSAVTLDNGHEEASKASVLELRSRPKKPWGLAEYGIRPPPADLLPDPAVEVNTTCIFS